MEKPKPIGWLSPTLRGVLAGAALAIAGGATLAAFSGDAAVWIIPLGRGTRAWYSLPWT